MSAEICEIPAAELKPVRFTLKQRLFIDFYLGDANFNGAEAARLAGYSHKTAREIAYENLAKPHLAREIERRLELIGLSEGEIKSRLGQMARGEIPTKTVTKGEETVDTYDKRQALEDAARIQGLLIDRHQIQPIQALLIEDGD
ncbi:terminase small subunit [bacterium]|nr:terminase small subunit [bacterium]